MDPHDPTNRRTQSYSPNPLHLPPLPRPPVLVPPSLSGPVRVPVPQTFYTTPQPFCSQSRPLHDPNLILIQPSTQTLPLPYNDPPPPYASSISPSNSSFTLSPSSNYSPGSNSPNHLLTGGCSPNHFHDLAYSTVNSTLRNLRLLTNDVWREDMRGLGTSMERLSVGRGTRADSSTSHSECQISNQTGLDVDRPDEKHWGPSNTSPNNKPLPPIPGRPNYRAPSPPRRPTSLPVATTSTPTPPPVPPRPFTEAPYPSPTNPSNKSKGKGKSFKPSFHPSRPRPSDESLLQPPSISASSTSVSKASPSILRPSTAIPVIDLTVDSDESDSSSDADPRSSSITPRSEHRQRRSRALSEQLIAPTSRTRPHRSCLDSPSSSAARCAGFTRSGQPCKRLVKIEAPYLSIRDLNTLNDERIGGSGGEEEGDDAHPRLIGRYCKDHASLVCKVNGFYWRGNKGRSGTWIEFKEYIPPHLGQQTQTLLRMTMESPLSAKELPGFLYAYELRDLATPKTSFFKVGRTDNVPRRIGQWSKQCASHTPTLRDIFPLCGLSRRPSAPTPLMPGALASGTDRDIERMIPAVKRWERLVHLELAERAQHAAPKACASLLKPCDDCGAIHKEIFPLEKNSYEDVVEVIERWEKFLRIITSVDR